MDEEVTENGPQEGTENTCVVKVVCAFGAKDGPDARLLRLGERSRGGGGQTQSEEAGHSCPNTFMPKYHVASSSPSTYIALCQGALHSPAPARTLSTVQRCTRCMNAR